MTSSVVPKTHDRPRQLISPVLAVICLGVMLLLDWLCPILFFVSFPLNLAGLLPVGVGLTLSFAAQRQFQKAGTTLYPFNRPDTLVTNGLFRYTRNPMYLGLVIFLTGAWFLMGSLTPLGVVGIFVLIADRWYIVNEEQKLTTVFGQAYKAYQARTPRWI
jgi:protein-S-isoprenylcysteine O-methyltransferase Ste14